MMEKARFLCTILMVALSMTLFAKEPDTYVLRSEKTGETILSQKGTDYGFFMPETGGYLRTGLVSKGKSIWLNQAQSLKIKNRNRGWDVLVNDPVLEKGELLLRIQPLISCNGLVIEISGKNFPEDLQVLWAYGGCSADTLSSSKELFFQPQQCRDNVFSREINAFTVYYGKTERLKVMMGVFPLQTETRLSDATKMLSPLELWQSGKKTEAPALAAACPIKNGEPVYACIYRQNQLADYNYYMLPALFEKESKQQSTQSHEKAKPHTDFGPDFHQQ